MATTTTTTFNLTAQQIITRALLIIGTYSPNDTLSTQDFNVGLDFLNMFAKHLETQGIHVWCDSRAIIWLQSGQATYNLGSTTTDHWATTYIETYLTNSLAAGATTVTVPSTTGMTTGDNIGIVQVLTNGTNNVFWTTLTVVNATTLTLTAPIVGTASSNNYVYTYTTLPNRPLQISSAIRRTGLASTNTLTDIIMPSISFLDYQQLTNKSQLGTPLQWRFITKNTSVNNNEITFWLTPNDPTQRVFIEYTRPILDFSTTTDNPDVPQEWLLALTYNLAVLLAPIYGKSDHLQVLEPMADRFLQEANTYDDEKTSLFFSPTQYRY